MVIALSEVFTNAFTDLWTVKIMLATADRIVGTL